MNADLPRAVIDTNVWISGLIRQGGPPARVIQAFRSGRFRAIFSAELQNEVEDVITRPRIRRRFPTIATLWSELLLLIRDRANWIEPTGNLQLSRDPADNFLLDLAVESRAHFLVSRDDDLKRDLDLIDQLQAQGIEIVSVAQFLERLGT